MLCYLITFDFLSFVYFSRLNADDKIISELGVSSKEAKHEGGGERARLKGLLRKHTQSHSFKAHTLARTRTHTE